MASRDVKNGQAVSAVHALWHGVRVLTYEGGPDTSCFFANPSSVPGKLMANLDPRMQKLTFEYLSGHAAGAPFLSNLCSINLFCFTRELCQIAVLTSREEQRSAIVPSGCAIPAKSSRN
jgi:hypothetical protein